MFERPDQVKAPLYVVTSVFNPIRYRSRWRLYQDFVHHVEHSGAILYTVEIAFGKREFSVTEAGNPRHLQLRTNHELWLKENALNLLIQRLPIDWEYVAWVDADVHFHRPDWANETVHQLQHHPVVQLWSEAVDLSPLHEINNIFKSFAWCFHHEQIVKQPPPDDYCEHVTPKLHYWHPGYAWGIRRKAYDALGGLVDWSILGGGDFFMARSIIDKHYRIPKSLGPSGKAWLERWRKRAHECLKHDLGYVHGLLMHNWHGPKAARKYKDRGQILTAGKFNPETDLVRDAQGLWQLCGNETLRDGVRDYFRERNEDAV